MSETGKAIFLSYASQDSETARKICETLRAAGIEVWFDTDGGLEHGDEWDAKIRKQLKECVLFIPIISANTQAREEGYFRLEWDLAVERARTIASGVPFILPVVIDETREPDALAPDRFRMVQWTRLPDGVVSAEVKQRFRKLWAQRAGGQRTEDRGRRTDEVPMPEPTPRRLAPAYGVAAVFAVLITGVLLWQPWRTGSPDSGQPKGPAAGPVSEVDRLVRQARELIYDPESARNEFALAEGLLKRAVELTPDSASALGASALLQHYFKSRGYDFSQERYVRSQAEAEKTLRLNPANVDALLALGLHRQVLGDNDRGRDYLERARAADPQNPRVHMALALLLPDYAARAKLLEDAASQSPRPAELLYYSGMYRSWNNQLPESVALLERAIAIQPFWRLLHLRAFVEFRISADPAKVEAWLNRVPELKRDEPRVVVQRWKVAMVRRDGAAAVRALASTAAEDFDDNAYEGPKAFLLAQSHTLAGQPERAAEQWQLAERYLRTRLAAAPGAPSLRAMLAVVLAGQRRTSEAKELADACYADDRFRSGVVDVMLHIEHLAYAYTLLGDVPRAVELLRRYLSLPGLEAMSPAVLAAEPRWDPLRASAEFQALLKTPSVTAAPADAKSIAVLPFANLSRDPDNEYFSDGLSENILDKLARNPGLRVMARTSSFFYKNKNLPITQIAQELKVGTIIEGSVQRVGQQLRVTAQLVNASDGTQVWSESFNRGLTTENIFAIQDEIALKIAARLAPVQVVVAEQRPTANLEAYNLYLRGRSHFRQRTPAEWRQSISYFEQAIRQDPAFALAYCGLADARALLAYLGQERPRDVFPAMRAAVLKAISLDDTLGDAHASLGLILAAYDWEWTKAEAEFKRALELAPGSIYAHIWYAFFLLSPRGRHDESLAMLNRALALDPVSLEVRYHLGFANYVAGRYDTAIAEYRRALELAPTFSAAHAGLGFVYSALGRNDEAIAEIRQADTTVTSNAVLGYMYARAGRRDDAMAILRALERRDQQGEYVIPSDYALLYEGLGESDEAFRWRRRALEERSPLEITWIGSPKLLDDARYLAMLRELGVTK